MDCLTQKVKNSFLKRLLQHRESYDDGAQVGSFKASFILAFMFVRFKFLSRTYQHGIGVMFSHFVHESDIDFDKLLPKKKTQ